ncbi:hypothetical protein pb186bvf_018007 [Paramecium bursaria]
MISFISRTCFYPQLIFNFIYYYQQNLINTEKSYYIMGNFIISLFLIFNYMENSLLKQNIPQSLIRIFIENKQKNTIHNQIQKKKPYSYSFNMILIGDVNVGKSSLLHQFEKNIIIQEYQPTIGVEFSIFFSSLQLMNQQNYKFGMHLDRNNIIQLQKHFMVFLQQSFLLFQKIKQQK